MAEQAPQTHLVHFVCTGNIYRSRMAEAYLRSVNPPHIEISSSGTEPLRTDLEYLSPFASTLLDKAGILQHASKYPTRTTPEIIMGSDLVIFMRRSHYLYCLKELHKTPTNFRIWNVRDLNEFKYKAPWDSEAQIQEALIKAQQTFERIRGKVDNLIANLPNLL